MSCEHPLQYNSFFVIDDVIGNLLLAWAFLETEDTILDSFFKEIKRYSHFYNAFFLNCIRSKKDVHC